MKHHVWLNEKPEFTEDCLLIGSSYYRDDAHFSMYIVKRMYVDGWYWAIMDAQDGMEWGDLGDFKADRYMTIPLTY